MAINRSQIPAMLRASMTSGTCLDPRQHGDTNLWEVEAADLVAAILETSPTPSRPRRLWLRGAQITGDLDLSGATVTVACEFESCRFENSIQIERASLRSLTLRDGSLQRGLEGNQSHIVGDLVLSGQVEASAPIQLAGAKVDGSILVENAKLHGDDLVALDCNRISVGENFVLGPGTWLGSALLLNNGSVKGNLSCSAKVSCPADRSIDANLMHVDGNVTFDLGYACTGTVRLAGATIGGRLHFDGGAVSKGTQRDYAIDAENICVAQNVDLGAKMTIDGPVHFAFAQLGAQLCLNGMTVRACGDTALNGQGAEVKGDVVVSDRSDVQGLVDFTGAVINGDLACDHAAFHNPANRAIVADRAQIGGSMFLRKSQVWGSVGLMGSHVGGDLDCIGAKIHNAGGDAIVVRRTQVDKDVLFCTGFAAEGKLDLVRINIAGSLRFEDSTFDAPGLTVIDLRGANIVGVFNLLPTRSPQGNVDLRDAKCAVLRDEEKTWPATFSLDGFTYGSLDLELEVPERLRWLQLNTGGYSARSYEQLINVLHSNGSEEKARRVALDGQHQRAKQVPWFVRPLYFVWGITVGYGYSLRRLFPWLVGLLTFGTVFFWLMYPASFTATAAHVPAFNPFVYTLDIVVPVFNLGENSAWLASGPTLYVGWALSVIGWALAAAIVAGLSQIVRRS
jgi:cytoskeletal protein CcmA (bactofilin family)